MSEREYLSFGVEFFSYGAMDTNAFVWVLSASGDLRKKNMASLMGRFTASENLGPFGGFDPHFLRFLAEIVAEEADPVFSRRNGPRTRRRWVLADFFRQHPGRSRTP